MGTTLYTLGVEEWKEADVRYVREFRDQITLLDVDRAKVEDIYDTTTYENHFFNARGELVAMYPNGQARYREGDRITADTGSFYFRVYSRIDSPPPGWPPKSQPVTDYEFGYD